MFLNYTKKISLSPLRPIQTILRLMMLPKNAVLLMEAKSAFKYLNRQLVLKQVKRITTA